MVSVESGAFRPLLSFGDTDDILIDFTQRFGQWSHGTYLKGYSKTHQKNVMVKVIDTAKFPLPKSTLDLEIAFLQRFSSNPYVVKMLEHKYLDTNLTVAIEICNKGNLRDYLKQTGPLPEEKAISLLLQIIYGLKGLHDMNFSHGALCPENILINEDNNNNITLKLSTFTYARHYTSDVVKKSDFVSDLKYMPLEFLKHSRYNLKSDLWSLGIIYYEMLYGVTPWTGANIKKLQENIFNKPLEFPTNDEISQTSVNFLSHCLQRDLDKRMDWADLMQNRLVSRALFSTNDGYFQLLNQGSPQKNLKSSTKGTPAGSPARNNKYYFSSRSLVIPSKPSMEGLRRQQTMELSNSYRADNSFSSYREEHERKKQLNQSVVVTARSSSVASKKEKSFAETPKISRGQSFRDQSFREQSYREKHYSEATPTAKTISNNTSINLKGTRFYDTLVTKTKVPNEHTPIKKFAVLQRNPGFSAAAASGLDRQCKWLACKADILGETYQLIAQNSEYPLYKKVNKLLKKESDKMQGGVASAQEKTARLIMDIQERTRTAPGSSRSPMVSARNPKFQDSMVKKQKSKEIYELLEEITAALLKNQKVDAKTETMIKVAANLKVLREFDEIGQNVVKELKGLKDILLVFYRKKDFTHVKYLLLVKNYV